MTKIEPYKYTIQDLVDAFSSSGLTISQSWVRRQENAGRLSLPRSTTNYKSVGKGKAGPVRIMTKTQLWDIVKAFLPGGSGKWFYKRGR